MKEFLFGADQDMLQFNRYDPRLKCAIFTFIEDDADNNAFDFVEHKNDCVPWIIQMDDP